MDELETSYKQSSLTFRGVLFILKRHIRGILIIILASVFAGGCSALFFVKNNYTGQVYISAEYTNNDEAGNNSGTLQMQVNTISDFLKTNELKKNVIDKLNANKEEKQKYELKDLENVTVKNSGNSSIFTISFSDSDSAFVISTLNAYLDAAIEMSKKENANPIVKDSLVKGNETSVPYLVKDSQNKIQILIIFIISGVVIGIIYAFIFNAFDQKIHSKEVLKNNYNINIIGTIPEFCEYSTTLENKQNDKE